MRRFADLWNEALGDLLPRCTRLTETRKRKIRKRLSENPLDWWEEVFRKIRETPFLLGEGDRGWKATIDWVIANQENATKILEGVYDGVPPPSSRYRRNEIGWKRSLEEFMREMSRDKDDADAVEVEHEET